MRVGLGLGVGVGGGGRGGGLRLGMEVWSGGRGGGMGMRIGEARARHGRSIPDIFKCCINSTSTIDV